MKYTNLDPSVFEKNEGVVKDTLSVFLGVDLWDVHLRGHKVSRRKLRVLDDVSMMVIDHSFSACVSFRFSTKKL